MLMCKVVTLGLVSRSTVLSKAAALSIGYLKIVQTMRLAAITATACSMISMTTTTSGLTTPGLTTTETFACSRMGKGLERPGLAMTTPLASSRICSTRSDLATTIFASTGCA